MSVQLVVPPELTAHVAVALEHHLVRCREQGIEVPRGLLNLRDWARTVQRGLSAPVSPPVPHDAAVEGQPVLLDLPGVAELLGVSLSTVKRLIAAGELRVVSVGRVRRVRRVDLEDYVARLGGEPETKETA